MRRCARDVSLLDEPGIQPGHDRDQQGHERNEHSEVHAKAKGARASPHHQCAQPVHFVGQRVDDAIDRSHAGISAIG